MKHAYPVACQELAAELCAAAGITGSVETALVTAYCGWSYLARMEPESKDLAVLKEIKDGFVQAMTEVNKGKVDAAKFELEIVRIEDQTEKRNLYGYLGIALMVFVLVGYALFLSKDDFAKSLMQTAIGLLAGGVGGYGAGLVRRAKE